jgi:hypothetical protein
VELGIRWRNPDNRNPRHADWKTTDDPGQSLGGPGGAYDTLVGRNAMQAAEARMFRELREVRREPVKRIPPPLVPPPVRRKPVKPQVKRKRKVAEWRRKWRADFKRRSEAAKLGWKRRKVRLRKYGGWKLRKKERASSASKTKAGKKPARQSKTSRKRVSRKTKKV